jgi:NADH:ubiquinone reductase (H+-translocating)
MAGSEKRVVIVGAGFGGLECAKALAGTAAKVTVIDRTNHHLFQPLLYQVAIAGLSPAEIAAPIRGVLAEQANVEVVMGNVVDVNTSAQEVVIEDGAPIRYDYLVLALGVKTSYFGNDAWEAHAPGLKSMGDAIEIRRRVLSAFERAEREPNEAERRALLTFVVVGGGPTGVELSGAIAELAKYTIAKDFRRIDPRTAQVILIEGGSRVLAAFDPSLSVSAKEQLEELGVIVRTGARVTAVDAGGVELGGERIATRTVLWAAGVRATRLSEKLAARGAELDKQGRLRVNAQCKVHGKVQGFDRVFAIGDMAHQQAKKDGHAVDDGGEPLPGLSPVAMQQGRFVAERIDELCDGVLRKKSFRYRDKGMMATIGRSRAIAQAGGLKLSGFLAWLGWLFVHLVFLVGFRSRVVVLFTWVWSYLSFQRGARIISERLDAPGAPRTR